MYEKHPYTRFSNFDTMIFGFDCFWRFLKNIMSEPNTETCHMCGDGVNGRTKCRECTKFICKKCTEIYTIGGVPPTYLKKIKLCKQCYDTVNSVLLSKDNCTDTVPI
jgi:hypothetical protein